MTSRHESNSNMFQMDPDGPRWPFKGLKVSSIHKEQTVLHPAFVDVAQQCIQRINCIQRHPGFFLKALKRPARANLEVAFLVAETIFIRANRSVLARTPGKGPEKAVLLAKPEHSSSIFQKLAFYPPTLRQNSSGSQGSAKSTCQQFLKHADNLNPYPFYGLGLTMSALSTVAEVPAVAIAAEATRQVSVSGAMDRFFERT